MPTLRLIAVPGRSLPREDLRSRMVDGTEAAPTVVESSAYYRRALTRGDVVEAPPENAPKPGKG